MKAGHFARLAGMLAAMLLGTGVQSHAAPLPSSVKAALQQAHIPLADVGIEVRAADARTPLIRVNDTKPMNPASTMKLLTTYAGLELLGPAHSWKTEAWLNGRLENGVLQGDLVLKGYGDPKFTFEQFWLWLRELRGRGLREIRGDLILDRSAFSLAPYDPAAFDHDPTRAYNVGPDALLLNFNVISLHVIPQDGKPLVLVEPGLDGISVDNQLHLVEQGDCDYWHEAVFPQLDDSTLTLQGSYPASCGEQTDNISLMPHPQYLGSVFRSLWQELGGTLRGKVREGTLTEQATLFATHHSEPLSELIRDINKFSNNVMARQLFLSLSLAPDAAASIARSTQAIHDWLKQKHLKFPELVIENGAGLSRAERISAHSMAQLLQAARRSPMQAEFEASLPIVGVDGTLKKRLRDSSATDHAHLKTGSLDGVKTLAGYVQSRSGKQWIVVFFINGAHASAGREAQDALVEWVHQH